MTIKNNLFFLFAYAILISITMPLSVRAEVMEDFSVVKIQALDKSTARTVTFQAKVGTTIQYGSLFIKTQACRKSPPLEKPESAAFLQVWEVPIGKEKSEWIFSGWMFASSPALSAMDHPVYDVWVLDCLSGDEENKEAIESETKKQTADPAALEPVEGEAEENQVPETQEKSQVSEEQPEQNILEEEVVEETAPEDKEIQELLDNVIEETTE